MTDRPATRWEEARSRSRWAAHRQQEPYAAVKGFLRAATAALVLLALVTGPTHDARWPVLLAVGLFVLAGLWMTVAVLGETS